MKQDQFNVKGMICKVCAMNIKKSINKLESVNSVDVDFSTKIASIHYNSYKITAQDIITMIKNIGYNAALIK